MSSAGTGAAPVRNTLKATARSKRYAFRLRQVGAAGANTTFMALSKPVGGKDIRVYRIKAFTSHSGVGTGSPWQVRRATGIATGTGVLFLQTDITKLDTMYANPTAEVRTGGGITATKAPFPFLTIGGTTTSATALGGPETTWEARDTEDMIVIRDNEGIVIENTEDGSNVNDRWYVSVFWEEAD